MTAELISRIKNNTVAEGRLAFWWLGQMGWFIKTVNHAIIIDPYLSAREKRTSPPALNPDEIDNVDMILCTHDHLDHIDHPVLPRIMEASQEAKLVVPRVAVGELVENDGIAQDRIVSASVGSEIDYSGIKVTPVKAKHEEFDYSEEYGYPYLQYIIEIDGFVLYHAGDTLLYDGMIPALSKWNFDIAFVPINGRDSMRYRRNCMGCMTWQEAADLCGEIKPKLVCPGHWDMFPDNSENPFLFVDYCKAKYPELSCWVKLSGDEGGI